MEISAPNLNILIKSNECTRTWGKIRKGQPAIEAKPAVEGVKAIQEKKDEAGNVIQAAVPGVKAVPAVEAEPAKPMICEVNAEAKNEEILMEIIARLNAEGYQPKEGAKIETCDYGVSIVYETKSFDKDATPTSCRRPFLDAFKKIKHRDHYNKQAHAAIEAEKKAKAEAEKKAKAQESPKEEPAPKTPKKTKAKTKTKATEKENPEDITTRPDPTMKDAKVVAGPNTSAQVTTEADPIANPHGDAWPGE